MFQILMPRLHMLWKMHYPFYSAQMGGIALEKVFLVLQRGEFINKILFLIFGWAEVIWREMQILHLLKELVVLFEICLIFCSKHSEKKRKYPPDLPDGSGLGDHIQLLQIYEYWHQIDYHIGWLKDNDLQVSAPPSFAYPTLRSTL